MAKQNVHKSTKILEDEHFFCCSAAISSNCVSVLGIRVYPYMAASQCWRHLRKQALPSKVNTEKNPEKTRAGIFGKKKAREISPRFNLQRRNRGETIKKQLLHLNEYGLSRPTVTLSTLFMLLGIIFVKNCRSRANKMFISEHQRYTDPATGNSAICPEHACTSGAADGICATITPILCPSSGTLPCRCCCLIPACTPVLTPITC